MNPFNLLGLSFRSIYIYIIIYIIIFNKVGSTISGITSTLHFWQQAQGIIIIQHRSTSCNYPTKDHHPKPQADPWWTKWSPQNHRCDVGIGCRRLPKGTTHMQRNSLQRNFLMPLLSIVVFEPGMFELLEDECHPWKYDNDIAIFWGFWKCPPDIQEQHMTIHSSAGICSNPICFWLGSILQKTNPWMNDRNIPQKIK